MPAVCTAAVVVVAVIAHPPNTHCHIQTVEHVVLVQVPDEEEVTGEVGPGGGLLPPRAPSPGTQRRAGEGRGRGGKVRSRGVEGGVDG